MEYRININAPRERVWNTLWADDTYREWTAVFAEGSRAETDWKKGSKVLFLDGKGQGMVSTIADNIPNEFMSIKHLGMVKDGIEDVDSEEARKWAGSFENYTLRATNEGTELTVTMEGATIPKDFEHYMAETWPGALDKLKVLCER